MKKIIKKSLTIGALIAIGMKGYLGYKQYQLNTENKIELDPKEIEKEYENLKKIDYRFFEILFTDDIDYLSTEQNKIYNTNLQCLKYSKEMYYKSDIFKTAEIKTFIKRWAIFNMDLMGLYTGECTFEDLEKRYRYLVEAQKDIEDLLISNKLTYLLNENSRVDFIDLEKSKIISDAIAASNKLGFFIEQTLTALATNN